MRMPFLQAKIAENSISQTYKKHKIFLALLMAERGIELQVNVRSKSSQKQKGFFKQKVSESQKMLICTQSVEKLRQI